MPENPRIYRSKNAPGSPKPGDLQFNESNNKLEQFGSAWGGITFPNVTLDRLAVSTPYASTNATANLFEVPGVAGAPTGAITPTTGNVSVVYDTTDRRLFVRTGGSWFATASLSLV